MRWVHCLAPWQRAAFVLLVVLHLAAPTYASWPRASSQLAALQDALPLAQMALLVVWLVLGPGPLLLRSPAALGMVWLVWRQSQFTLDDLAAIWRGDAELRWLYLLTIVESNHAVALLTLHAAVLLFALTVLRLFGFRFRSEPVGLSPRNQYSLRTLFLLTTAVALGLSLREQLRSFGPLDEALVPKALALPAAALAFTAAALICLRAALAPGSPLLRSLLALGLCGAVGSGLAQVCGRESDWLPMAAWLAGFGLIASASLLVVRACGYRLAHRAEIVEPAFTVPAPRPLSVPPSCPEFLVLLENA